MKRSKAFGRVRNELSAKVYQRLGDDRWRRFSYDIRGLRTTVVSEHRVPSSVLAEHYSTGSSMIFTDGFFETQSVECEEKDDGVTLVVTQRSEDDGAAQLGAFAGRLIKELLK